MPVTSNIIQSDILENYVSYMLFLNEKEAMW